MIVSWVLSKRITLQLMIDAFQMARRRALIKHNAIIQTDRGSQYAAVEFRRLLYIYGFRQSMPAKGNCYDMVRYLLLVLALMNFSICQNVSAQYRFDSWTTDNGLPQNGVRTIAQTPDGYLWFTTLDGLVRFDGLKFTIFDKGNSKGIINNRFWVLRAFADGSVWAATEVGDLTIYKNGVFTSYSAAQIPDEKIFDFLPEGDEVLIHTDANFYKLQNGKFIFIKANENNDNSGKIYQGQSGTRWEIYPSETIQIKENRKTTYAIPVKFTDRNFDNVYEDLSGGLWIADEKRLVYLRDGNVTEYDANEGYPVNLMAHHFWENDDRSLWFTTGFYGVPGIGLVKFKDGKFAQYGTKEGLSNEHIFDVFKDREGTNWIATDKGLNRLRQQIITSLSKKDGLVDNEVYPILRTRDGSIYLGTVGGLSRYKDGKFSEVVLSRSKQTVLSVQSLWEDDEGRLWVGLVGGLFVIENGTPRDVSSLFGAQRTVAAIYSDSSGDIWFGTGEGGIYQYRDDKIIANYTTAQGLAGNDVKAIYEAQDKTLWLGTYTGLSHFKDGKFTNYTTNEGLPGNFVRSIKEDADGTLWVGTYDSGLARFKDGRFFNFNTENGLFNNGVFAIQEDRRGNFWMSSNRGIFRSNKQQLNDYADGKTDHYDSVAYGKDDGMLNTECNGGRQPSSVMDRDGKIWFPTLEGVSIVNPEVLKTNNLPPPVEIEEVDVDRENISFNPNSVIELSPSQNYLDITYTALSLIKSDQIRFRYKLEGLDKEWINAGTRRTVNYSYLPPGEYVFKVIAANSDGVWNMDGKSLKIIIAAPFYKTLRFWLALFVAFSIIAYLIYRYQITQLRKINLAQEAFSRQLLESQEAERKRIAQELHDGLGQNLLIIKNRALLGLSTTDKDEQLNEIQESVTDALSEVRTIAYNLRPLHIERLGLTSTIEEIIEDVEKSSGIEINCDIANIDNLLTPENEINFYRIVQECLNNIIKHSAASKARVEVFLKNDRIILIIKDNGKGFEIDQVGEKKGLGLSGIAERAKILGGSYSVTSETGQGTVISIEITPKHI